MQLALLPTARDGTEQSAVCMDESLAMLVVVGHGRLHATTLRRFVQRWRAVPCTCSYTETGTYLGSPNLPCHKVGACGEADVRDGEGALAHLALLISVKQKPETTGHGRPLQSAACGCDTRCGPRTTAITRLLHPEASPECHRRRRRDTSSWGLATTPDPCLRREAAATCYDGG